MFRWRLFKLSTFSSTQLLLKIQAVSGLDMGIANDTIKDKQTKNSLKLNCKTAFPMRYNLSSTLRPSSLLQPGLSPCRAKNSWKHQHRLGCNILHCHAAVSNYIIIPFTNNKIVMPVCFTWNIFPWETFPDLRDTLVKFKQCWGNRVHSWMSGYAWRLHHNVKHPNESLVLCLFYSYSCKQ